MCAMQYHPAQQGDAPRLAELRVAAMRPSLEAIGRFDAHRARQRFLDGFDPSETFLIMQDDNLAGFFVLRLRCDHLRLEHLHIDRTYQGLGLGRAVIRQAQSQATDAGLPLRVTALRDSPANAFYLSCGFAVTLQETFDIHYHWLVQTTDDPV